MPVPWKALAVCAAVLLLALHSLPRPNRTPRLLASPSAIPPTVSQALGAAAPAPPSQRPQPPAALDRVPLRPPVAAPRAPATHHHRPQALRPVPTPRSRAHWGLWLAAAAVGAVCLAARATRRAPAPRSAGRWAAVAMAADTPWPTHDDRQRFFEGNDAAYGRGPFRGDGEAVRYGEPRYEDRHGGAPSWEAAGKEEEENFAMKTRFVNRKDMYGAPYHQRRLLMSSPLSREMREKYGVRTMPVRKGDIVRVRLGKFAGIEGMVTRTYHEKLLIFVEGVERRKNDFAKQRIGLDASKLEILDMMMDEPRKDVLLRKLRREPMSKEYIEAIEKAYQMTPSYNRFKNPIWYTDGLDSKHNKKGFF